MEYGSEHAPGKSVFLLLSLAWLAGCHGRAASPKALTAVRASKVERSSGAGGVRYSASINPAARVDLAFKVGGYVQSVARVRGVDGKPRLVQAGDRVTRGTELAALRTSDFQQKLAEAKAQQAEATAAKDQAQFDFTRATRLEAGRGISQAQYDAARATLETATARQRGAAARVAEAETALSDSRLRAPMDGVLLSRSIEVGTLVSPGTVALVIADVQSVKVVFGVPDTALADLRLGAEQVVTTEARRGVDYVGHVTRISPAADPKSRVFEVEVTLPNQDGQLKAGMIASLKLAEADSTAPAVMLPLSAIVRSPLKRGGFAVYVLDDKPSPPTVRVRDVELGEFRGNVIPIRSGLREGERVVVMGASLVSDGEQVQVIP